VETTDLARRGPTAEALTAWNGVFPSTAMIGLSRLRDLLTFRKLLLIAPKVFELAARAYVFTATLKQSGAKADTAPTSHDNFYSFVKS
jgi:hypothetical protein